MWNSNSVSAFYSRWYSEIYHTITFNGIEFIWISWCSLCPSLSSSVANVPDYIWFERVLKEEKTLYLRNKSIFCQILKCVCIAFQRIYKPCEKRIFNEYSTKNLESLHLKIFVNISYPVNCFSTSIIIYSFGKKWAFYLITSVKTEWKQQEKISVKEKRIF